MPSREGDCQTDEGIRRYHLNDAVERHGTHADRQPGKTGGLKAHDMESCEAPALIQGIANAWGFDSSSGLKAFYKILQFFGNL